MTADFGITQIEEWDISDGLDRFCRSFISREEIKKIRRTGISDADLEKYFRRNEATDGGDGGPGMLWMQYWVNAKTAKVWIGGVSDWLHKKPLYEGKKLVSAVRLAMKFPYPGGELQEMLVGI